MTIAEQAREVGQQVISSTGATLAIVVNAAIGRFAGWPFKTMSGNVIDREGTRTESFACVAFTPASGSQGIDPTAILADNVAAVIDATETMNLESLGAAYRRIALAKRLKKCPAPNVPGGTNTTLGLIFAPHSDLSLEYLAEELQRLNAQTPSTEWPDMVAIASAGTIHYAVQFPGQSLSGDYLPPVEGALDKFTPPVYVVMVIRPTGEDTFNKFLAFLVAHLAIFSPGAEVPNFTQVQEGVPQTAIVITGYQYNLRGELVPVPRRFYNDRYLPPLPMRIEDRRGKLLSRIQYLPWQDGGVLLLDGKLPLDGLMGHCHIGRSSVGGMLKSV